MTRRKELKRVDVGIAIFGGTTAPYGAYQLYRIDWSDGTSSIERGRSLYSLPGSMPVGSKMPKEVRTDLGTHMAAASILIGPIKTALWELDVPQPKKRKKRS